MKVAGWGTDRQNFQFCLSLLNSHGLLTRSLLADEQILWKFFLDKVEEAFRLVSYVAVIVLAKSLYAPVTYIDVFLFCLNHV